MSELTSVADKAIAVASKIDTASLLDKVVGYTQQMIDAALPVAKQAYEIGLVTLRIDAIGQLVLGFVYLCGIVLVLCLFTYSYKKIWALEAPESDKAFTTFVVGLGMFLGILLPLSIGCFYRLLDVWLWVKAFWPDLWLAHMAIDKILK